MILHTFVLCFYLYSCCGSGTLAMTLWQWSFRRKVVNLSLHVASAPTSNTFSLWSVSRSPTHNTPSTGTCQPVKLASSPGTPVDIDLIRFAYIFACENIWTDSTSGISRLTLYLDTINCPANEYCILYWHSVGATRDILRTRRCRAILLFPEPNFIFSFLHLWRVAVTRTQDIPYFGPSIPEGAVFDKDDQFRDFLLAKCTCIHV